MDFFELINHFVSLLVIANPLSALPAILRLTRHHSLNDRRKIGLVSTFSVAVIFLLSTWIGMPFLMILGIGLPSFQIAGGLILLILAFSMLNAEESTIKATVEEQKEKKGGSIAVVPLAIPIIAGPAAISSIIVSVNQHPGILNQLLISFSSLTVALVIGVLLYFANHLEKVFGHSGINVMNRIGGLLLAAIAIQAIANGLIGIFPVLKS